MDVLKDSIVNPLLKGPAIDSEVLKNYRPVSDVFLSKLTERVVDRRLFEHNNLHCIYEPSTETFVTDFDLSFVSSSYHNISQN